MRPLAQCTASAQPRALGEMAGRFARQPPIWFLGLRRPAHRQLACRKTNSVGIGRSIRGKGGEKMEKVRSAWSIANEIVARRVGPSFVPLRPPSSRDSRPRAQRVGVVRGTRSVGAQRTSDSSWFQLPRRRDESRGPARPRARARPPKHSPGQKLAVSGKVSGGSALPSIQVNPAVAQPSRAPGLPWGSPL